MKQLRTIRREIERKGTGEKKKDENRWNVITSHTQLLDVCNIFLQVYGEADYPPNVIFSAVIHLVISLCKSIACPQKKTCGISCHSKILF